MTQANTNPKRPRVLIIARRPGRYSRALQARVDLLKAAGIEVEEKGLDDRISGRNVDAVWLGEWRA